MIDFTKLRDLIIEKKCVSSSDYDEEDPFIGIYWEDLIDIINQCDSEKWISVEEALPEVNELVFGCVNDEGTPQAVGMVYYDEYGGWHYSDEEEISLITHWMPIPSLEGGEK